MLQYQPFTNNLSSMHLETNLDPYVLVVTFILGAASALLYIHSLEKRFDKTGIEIEDNKNLSSNKNSIGKNEIDSENISSEGNKEEINSLKKNKKDTSSKKEIRIYVDGCWDLCHSGHYNAIRQAKSLGDHLVVGVHSCEEIARHKRWPIMNDKERVACVESCKWVDSVVFDVPYSPSIELLDRDDVSCDYVAHGDDIAITANGKSAYEQVESRLKIFKRTPGVSTTKLIDRLICALKYQESINIKKENNKYTKEDINKGNIINTNNTDVNTLSSGSSSSLSSPITGTLCDAKNDNNDNNDNNSSNDDNNTINNNDNNNNNKSIQTNINKIGSWSQFLSSSHRIAAFSNNKIPKSTDKVIYIDGIFDLFHAGHIAAIKEAKKEGTFLYVGLFDDTTVRKNKGPYFPLMNIQERTLNVLSCKFVDEVIIGCPWNITQDMINVLNIDTIITTNITNELTNENDERYKIAIKNKMLKHIETKDSQLTTQSLMKRIANDQERMQKENENRIKKEIAYLESRKYVQES